jgi:ATP-dependent RNA helicase DHX37/DHR1
MSAFPLHPRHSKMIILGQQFNNMPYLIAIVAGLSVGDPFTGPEEIDAESQDGSEESTVVGPKMRKYEESRQKFSALDPECDVLRLLCAIGAYEAGGSADSFCVEHFLRIKVMKEIRKLRIQITNIVNNQLSGIVAPVQFSANLQPPSALQIRTIKQVVTAAYLDRIAIRSDLVDSNSPSKKTTKTSRAEYLPMIAPTRQAMMTDFASIHPRSAVANASSAPEYIGYSDIRASQKTGRLRLMPLTTVSPREIEPLARGTPLIQYSKPLNYPPPRVFTDNGVMKKEIYVVPRFGTHGRGWELPSIKRVENLVKNDEFRS